MFSAQINPPYDLWKEYTLPLLKQQRIVEVCKDILKRAENSDYREIYDAIAELVESDIECEYLEGEK